MKSSLPKVLHPLCGRPLLHYPVRAALDAGCGEVVVVVGHGRAEVEAYLAKAFGDRVKTAVQVSQRGTGDAAKAGLSAVSPDAERILLYYGDVPLLLAADVAKVAAILDEDTTCALAMATCEVEDPTGYGRVLRDAHGQVSEIREHRDLVTDAERAVREMNPGIYAATVDFFRKAIEGLAPNNAQGEYYLTDIVKAAVNEGRRVATVPSRADVIEGVNDRDQLAKAEVVLQARIVRDWRVRGVTVRDGARIEDAVTLGADAVVEAFAVLRGATTVGPRAVVDVGSVLTDVVVEEGAKLLPYTIATSSRIGAAAQIGPFSHLRPESDIGPEAHVGNFVETKKTSLARGAKANHLAYLGDGVIGEGANIGAGTIFCNYDGYQKQVTRIGAKVFIGSDSQLVAPVTIGDGAYVGTGTCVTKDVPANALAIGRVRQENKEGYAEALRAKLAEKKAAAKAAK